MITKKKIKELKTIHKDRNNNISTRIDSELAFAALGGSYSVVLWFDESNIDQIQKYRIILESRQLNFTRKDFEKASESCLIVDISQI